MHIFFPFSPEVITSAEFHPTHCNMLAYSSSKGSIRLIDLRQSALCDGYAKLWVVNCFLFIHGQCNWAEPCFDQADLWPNWVPPPDPYSAPFSISTFPFSSWVKTALRTFWSLPILVPNSQFLSKGIKNMLQCLTINTQIHSTSKLDHGAMAYNEICN